ncbi:MAG: PEGA domain-containing protein [Myxococcales bacterium]|nr:PEGA domain-containing protein [Myxococcales bacterium]
MRARPPWRSSPTPPAPDRRRRAAARRSRRRPTPPRRRASARSRPAEARPPRARRDAPSRRAPSRRPSPPLKAEPPPPAAAATAPGTLAIAAAPWADVYVDGKHRGRTPYLKQLTLPPGAHALELRNPGFPPHKETVTVKSGETVTRRVRLGSRPR